MLFSLFFLNKNAANVICMRNQDEIIPSKYAKADIPKKAHDPKVRIFSSSILSTTF